MRRQRQQADGATEFQRGPRTQHTKPNLKNSTLQLYCPGSRNVPVSVNVPRVNQVSTTLSYRLLLVDLYSTIGHVDTIVFSFSSS